MNCPVSCLCVSVCVCVCLRVPACARAHSLDVNGVQIARVCITAPYGRGGNRRKGCVRAILELGRREGGALVPDSCVCLSSVCLLMAAAVHAQMHWHGHTHAHARTIIPSFTHKQNRQTNKANTRICCILSRHRSDVEKVGAPINKRDYKQFWSLQRFFCEPRLCYRVDEWKAFETATECVLDLFDRHPLEDISASVQPSTGVCVSL